MKHLKKYNEEWDYTPGKKADHELAEEIANDLLPRFQKMREEGKKVTVADFDKYMEERTATFELSDSVMNILVDRGFDFDVENADEEIEEPYIKENVEENKREWSLKEKEVGKTYDQWSEAEKLQGLIDLAVDGFHLNLSRDKLERMTKEEIIEKCDSYYEWFLKLKSTKKGGI